MKYLTLLLGLFLCACGPGSSPASEQEVAQDATPTFVSSNVPTKEMACEQLSANAVAKIMGWPARSTSSEPAIVPTEEDTSICSYFLPTGETVMMSLFWGNENIATRTSENPLQELLATETQSYDYREVPGPGTENLFGTTTQNQIQYFELWIRFADKVILKLETSSSSGGKEEYRNKLLNLAQLMVR